MNQPITKNKKVHSPHKYQKIIEAATTVFARKGFHTAKISDIAKAAEVADGTIYLYFKNKDDLLISVFEYSIELFIRTLERALAELHSPIEKLRCFIQIYLKLIKKSPQLAQVIQLELRQSSKFMKEYTHTKFFAFLAILADILQEGKEQHLFREDINPFIVRRAFFGAIDEIALEWLLMKKKKYTIEEAAQQLSDIFITGLLLRQGADYEDSGIAKASA